MKKKSTRVITLLLFYRNEQWKFKPKIGGKYGHDLGQK